MARTSICWANVNLPYTEVLHLKTIWLSFVKGYADLEIDYFQSNIEGEMIDCIQQVGFEVDGIILNAGAYTHYLHRSAGCHSFCDFSGDRGTYF